MDTSYIDELKKRLDVITRLLAYQVAMSQPTLEAKAHVLSSAGLKPKEIAELCGATANTVSVLIARAKKKKKKGG